MLLPITTIITIMQGSLLPLLHTFWGNNGTITSLLPLHYVLLIPLLPIITGIMKPLLPINQVYNRK